jgi:uroporphyrinogen-III decarboxylase
LADYCANGPGSCDVHLKCWNSFSPTVDAVQCDLYNTGFLSPQWLSNVKVPGVELPPDELWQVEEAETMKVDDYKKIVEGGFYNWFIPFIKEHFNDPLGRVATTIAEGPVARQKYIDAGIVPLVSAIVTIPFEVFCGGRSMIKFMTDMIKHADLLEEAIKVAAVEMLEANRQMLRAAKPLGVWVGGWRGASNLMSLKMWERFVWPYFKATTEMVIEEGVIPILHLDANWTSSLDYFKEIPKYKCIMSPDGATDIHKARLAMDNHMAILGDVHAEMLAFDTPKDVKDYVHNLIKEFGGVGYMVSSGCDIPFNARVENVQAMISAVYDA